MMNFNVALALTIILPALGIWSLLGWQRRRSTDVLRDLSGAFVAEPEPEGIDSSINSSLEKLLKAKAGNVWLQPALQRSVLLLCAALGLSCSLIFGGNLSFANLLFSAIFGLAVGYVLLRVQSAAAARNYRRRLEFYLPVVMERVVMAVQAGLDIVAALKRVVQLEKDSVTLVARQSGISLDPVTELLEISCNLCESGLGFEDSLRQVATGNPSFAVRHAFIHLALAYKEGGGLVMPLTELSDSTQLYYQESIEEDIARMPVKATMPLVLTFAGLIVCFITAPLMQVLSIVNKAMPG